MSYVGVKLHLLPCEIHKLQVKRSKLLRRTTEASRREIFRIDKMRSCITCTFEPTLG
jgi:hypothetical protein